MAKPLDGVGGAGAERGITSADVIAEARLRQAERLQAAQAENDKSTEVVEGADKGQQAGIPPRQPSPSRQGSPSGDDIKPFRVKLDPDTRRIYTEVLDTDTGAVIMRIPASYADPEIHSADATGEGDPDDTPVPPEGEVKA